jgi:hypothetical protein
VKQFTKTKLSVSPKINSFKRQNPQNQTQTITKMENETIIYISIIETINENHPNAMNIADAYCIACLQLNELSKRLELTNEKIGYQFICLNKAYQYILETKHGVQS